MLPPPPPSNHNEKERKPTHLGHDFTQSTSINSKLRVVSYARQVDGVTSAALNISIPTSREPSVDTTVSVARQKAELAFCVGKDLLLNSNVTVDIPSKTNKKMTRRETRIRQIALLLTIPIASARNMPRLAPSSESMDTHSLARKCVEMSILLQCNPSLLQS